MIDYIKGEITELTPASVTLETYGVGYFISISLNTYSSLTGRKSAQLFIYEAIREDAHQLFGFFDKQERELFMLLISVSGIGASTGRMILSSMNTQELANVIASGNSDMLKTVKGIGLKTAQRVIVDLKDKIKVSGIEQVDMFASGHPSGEEAVAALVMLGFTQQASQKVVAKILKDKADSTVEQIIKTALKML
ncbi:MAG: Holliday junction branch migration protein RuvA [Dysgonomonas sp.]|jgi:Holliday junction DNA helicase RuvA|uniref:Holliday junction branch migration protein RuvA n=1 Tax=unclassified Dysgonomonas TaxID=2630389 RepID=UPI0025BA6EE7|nr:MULTISPECIES: Holliday junction branch migration protein RuvA [unclassified Dysgonomonas]MDR1716879.1 Holliday junction branch migration protein RuvA [Prevotella sp.]MDR2004648.1 Holliday junction branch migration protein RuvA [Prevotella sp.]HMM02159.1 Holliday junction branch migration protein RuvA [Dysgonomonas sp.]